MDTESVCAVCVWSGGVDQGEKLKNCIESFWKMFWNYFTRDIWKHQMNSQNGTLAKPI